MPDAEDFHRIKRLPPGFLAGASRLKAACRAADHLIIDTEGNPDIDTPARLAENPVETAPGRHPQPGETRA